MKIDSNKSSYIRPNDGGSTRQTSMVVRSFTDIGNRDAAPNLAHFRKLKGHPGFSLTEMLVVIVIITIVAAIGFPMASKYLDRAKDSTCLSNLRQIGIAIKMYANDNNDTIVPAFATATNPITWQNRLDSQLNLPANTIRGTAAWQCPKFLKFRTPNRPSYVVNYNLTMFTQPTRFIQVPEARRLVLVMENYNVNHDWFNQNTLSGLDVAQRSQVFRHGLSSATAGTSRVVWTDLSISDASFNELQANRFDLRKSLWVFR